MNERMLLASPIALKGSMDGPKTRYKFEHPKLFDLWVCNHSRIATFIVIEDACHSLIDFCSTGLLKIGWHAESFSEIKALINRT
jgi:hypothetical protein